MKNLSNASPRPVSWAPSALALAIGMGVAAGAGGTALAQTGESGSGIEEVIVTAQRREETAQRASVSIEVLTAQTLERAGVVQATDIPRIAPGVQVTQGGTAIQVYIRGSGDFSTTAFSNAAVAQNYDGVSAARSQYIAGTFFDLERVEVLKGPQGTLYGRNATGGALNILPTLPRLGEYSGYATVGLQNYDGRSFEGALNIPLGEQAALRASLQTVDRDGYIDDGTNDDVHTSARLQMLLEATNNLTIRVGANYQDFGGRGPGYVVYEPNPVAFVGRVVPSDPWTSINNSLVAASNAFNAGPGPDIFLPLTSQAFQDNTAWGLNAHVDWDLGFGTLTVIPAYQYVENNSFSVPTLNFWNHNPFTGKGSTSDTDSLEVRLGDANEQLKWVVGAYYFNEDQDTSTWLHLLNVSDTLFSSILNTESYAAFGEVNFSLTDNFRAIAGVRYTSETKSVDGFQYLIPGSVGCTTPGTGPGGSCQTLHVVGDYGADRTNYRVGFEYDLAENNMLFATVATGFKSGGQVNAALPPYRPEDLTSYTIGSRNRFFNNALQVNGELFYIEYSDHQENFSVLDSRGRQVQALLNAGSATSQGASLDIVYRPTSTDEFHVGAEYTEATYGEFTYFAYNTGPVAPPSVGCPVTQVLPIPAGVTATGVWSVNCADFQMARTPLWAGSASYTHTFLLPNGGDIDVTPDLTFASSRWVEAAFVPNDRAPAYVVYNLSATYHAPEDRYSLQVFARNITEEPVYTGGQQNPFIAGYVGLNIGDPRTYGAKLRINF